MFQVVCTTSWNIPSCSTTSWDIPNCFTCNKFLGYSKLFYDLICLCIVLCIFLYHLLFRFYFPNILHIYTYLFIIHLMSSVNVYFTLLNSFWPSNTIWWHGTGSTLVYVWLDVVPMCLTMQEDSQSQYADTCRHMLTYVPTPVGADTCRHKWYTICWHVPGPPTPDQSVYHVRTQVWKTLPFCGFWTEKTTPFSTEIAILRLNKTPV